MSKVKVRFRVNASVSPIRQNSNYEPRAHAELKYGIRIEATTGVRIRVRLGLFI